MKIWALDETLKSSDLNANFSQVEADIAAAQASAEQASVPASAPGSSLATLTNGLLTPAQVPLTVGDGTHSVANTTNLLFPGATVSGGNGSATVALPSGGSAGGSQFTRPPLAAFAAYNFQSPQTGTGPSTTAVDTTGGPLTIQAAFTSGTNYVEALEQTLAQASKWTLVAAIASSMPTEPYMSYGVSLRESATGKIMLVGRGSQASWRDYLSVQYWASSSSYSSTKWIFGAPRDPMPFLRIQDDGTNLIVSISRDGIAPYAKLISVPRGDFVVPDKIGVYVNPVDSSNTMSQMSVDLYNWQISYQ